MVISNCTISNNEEKAKISFDISSEAIGNDTLWFTVPIDYKDALAKENYDPALICMLYLSMLYGEDLIIKGNVSPKLYHNVVWYVEGIFQSFNNDAKKIKIEVDNLEAVKKYDNQLNATGFSGGVDSFCTIYDHLYLEKQEEYKINCFLFLNVGSHGKYTDPSSIIKFQNRYDYLKNFTDSVNLPFVYVDSNVHKFHKDLGHQHTGTITLAAGVIVLQKLISKYYVSSAISYNEMDQWPKAKSFSIGEYADPFLLPLLSTESIEFIPDGQQYLRTEKTKRIMEYSPVMQYLNVCVNNKTEDKKNCSYCNKCCRTLLAIEASNNLERFSSLFDLHTWKKVRFKYICREIIRYNKDPFAKDNIDFMRKNAKNVPIKIVAFIVSFPSIMIGITNRLLKIILPASGYNFLRKVIGK